MTGKNSRGPAWRINQSLQSKHRNNKELDRLAQALVKEIKGMGHARDFPDLPEHIKSDPGWRKIISDNTATGAINVLVSLGGSVREFEYIFCKMYSLDRNLFWPKGWGSFLDSQTGVTNVGGMRRHLDYSAGTYPKSRPKKGFVFECTLTLKELGDDDYFHVIDTWMGSPNQEIILSDIVEIKKSEEESESGGDIKIKGSPNQEKIVSGIVEIKKSEEESESGGYIKIKEESEPGGYIKIKYDEERDKITVFRDKKNLYDFFENKGFFFSQEVLTRYFLSLKTKPFVILTGISGTGKTKIAQIFANYICQNMEKREKEKRIAFISVCPDWMDNKGLLGFYNILDETYHETPLLNLLLEARDNPDVPYFVILDEMNLAKVEQYFSDFLSIMESRISDKMIGEPIFLHSLDKVKTLSGNEIPGRIYIPENIYFTGTVNVDESTYMFSPKVLDRANVIEFNEVNLEGYISGSGKDDQFSLANPDVTNDLTSTKIEPFCSIRDFIKLKEIIKNKYNPFEKLLTCLKKYNLHFGYRVVNEMSRFVWISKDFMEDHFDIDEAFDIQILQKILPKFHGTQGKLENPLKDLLSLCYGQTNLQENVSDDIIQKAEGYDEEAVYPRSAQKIARMLKNLKNKGYTSFIE